LKAGDRVSGRYTIERELGRGGMGIVYEARDEKFHALVALKVATADEGEPRARFEREALIGNRLGKQQGFVRAFDWGELEEEKGLYLAMDLVPGARALDLARGTLAERLERFTRAARLVALAHASGIIHRDLKPANFLQASDGSLWLSDFGLAKARNEADASTAPSFTRAGAAMGTPAFMPPEQFDDARAVDERADVYALGVMLHQALTGGRVPFEGGAGSIVQKQLAVSRGASPAPRPSLASPDVPPALDQVCARAIQLERSDRFASVQELLDALDAALGKSAAPPTLPPTHVSAGKPAERPRRRTGIGLILAVVVLSALLASAHHPPKVPAPSAPPDQPPVQPVQPPLPPPHQPEPPATTPPKLPPRVRENGMIPAAEGKSVPGYVLSLPDGTDLELVYVPPGEYKTGASGELKGTIEKGYFLGRFSVTWKQYLAFCTATKHAEPNRPGFFKSLEKPELHPVVLVTIEDAREFCKWANGHVPTEGQWERAARGTDGRQYPWGNEWDWTRVNYCDSSCPPGTPATPRQTVDDVKWRDLEHDDGFPHTSPVGTFPKGVSPVGALDMAGNVANWIETTGSDRLVKGGSWLRSAPDLRTCARHAVPIVVRWHWDIGLRLELDAG